MILTWSLADAWHWLINVPVLGFVALLVLAIVTLVGLLAAKEAMKDPWRRPL